MATGASDTEENAFNLTQALLDACATIPENLAAVMDNLLDPLGINIGDVSSLDMAAEDQEVTTGTYTAMQASFDGRAGAFAYLLFILLYAPCVAATTAIYRETSAGWAIFVLFWTTGLAYITATIFYQTATYTQHPTYSAMWIAGLIAMFLCVLAGLWFYGKSFKVDNIKENVHDPI